MENIEICRWLKENTTVLGSYVINQNNTININGSIYINDNVTEFPYKFNKVFGNFICYNCKELKSLHNSPDIIHESFDCSYTDIDSYEGGPKEIDGNLYCTYNNILTLLPYLNGIKMNRNSQIFDNSNLNGIFYKKYIKVKNTEEYLKKSVIKKWLNENTEISIDKIYYGSYKINDDYSIDVTGDININPTVSDLPYKFNKINGSFNCCFCENLKSLHNTPNIIKGNFNFSETNIDSYEGGPKEIDGNLICFKTKIKSAYPLLNQIKMKDNSYIMDNQNIKGIEYKKYIKYLL